MVPDRSFTQIARASAYFPLALPVARNQYSHSIKEPETAMSTPAGLRQINDLVEREARFVQVLDREIRKAIIGQDRLVERALVALLADGHILLEGVPGLAKTLLVKTIGQAIEAGFFPDPVHSRPAARRSDRHSDLQPPYR